MVIRQVWSEGGLCGSCRIRICIIIFCGDREIVISTGQAWNNDFKSALGHRVVICGPTHNVHMLLWMWATGRGPHLSRQVLKAGLLLSCSASYELVMESSICLSFSDLPVEIALIIFKYAAKPTFSQKEEYNDQNPYANALSLCLVSRLVRLTVLPELLHTVLLPTRRSLEAFASALESQKKYTEDSSHLAFDYTHAVQRLWLAEPGKNPILDAGLKQRITTLLPVLLAVPTLAVQPGYLSLIDESLEGSQSLGTDPNVDQRTLPCTWENPDCNGGDLPALHQALPIHSPKTCTKNRAFLASVSHLTYLTELNPDSDTFRDVSKGIKSPDVPLGFWMGDIPRNCMNSLETFSVVYPHLGLPHKVVPFFRPEGVDLHVQRLTVSAPVDMQNPESFPSVTAPFPITLPGEEGALTKGVSSKVTHDQGHFQRWDFTWEKVWACGLTD
ncbi:hypothetical protein EDD22DRAFT_579774 [Suillus occidentalis]|nr:hypothetical protein EDD22DRAFT_579774 [Suillus occidentalis]